MITWMVSSEKYVYILQETVDQKGLWFAVNFREDQSKILILTKKLKEINHYKTHFLPGKS